MQHQITLHGVVHTVDATEPVPGLRAYRLPAEHQIEMGYNARLGHHSGLLIARFERLAEAEHAAHLIAPLADWTQDGEDLRSLELGEQVSAVIAHQTHGFMGVSPTDDLPR